MPLIAILFLVFALFMVSRVPRGNQAVWLGLILFTFGCCILGLVGFIARFGNYQLEGFIMPMDQPSWAWRVLAHLPLDTFMRFRLWSMVLFTTAVVGFSFSYALERWKRADYIILGIILSLAGLLLWNYDPVHLFSLYKHGAGLLKEPGMREAWERNLRLMDFVSLLILTAILIFALARIFLLCVKSTILQKRAQTLGVVIGCGVLCVFHIVLFVLGPAGVLNAHSVATTLLPVVNYPVFDTTYLQALPFAGIVAFGAVMLSIFKYGFLGTWRIGARDLDRQINVANQAVRLALHSFKNRFLAIQMAMNMVAAELERLKEDEGGRAKTQVRWAQEVCAEALAQLDILHIQSDRVHVKASVLSWRDLWEEAKHRCAGRMNGITVFPVDTGNEACVWGDREHLVSVLENLLQNALDALTERKTQGFIPWIKVEIGREYEWSYIRITDNGPGIPRKDLRKVFRPFFTTKPSKTNWGMGLAYCHRVIKAHRGYINIRSQIGMGTMVEVVMRGR